MNNLYKSIRYIIVVSCVAVAAQADVVSVLTGLGNGGKLIEATYTKPMSSVIKPLKAFDFFQFEVSSGIMNDDDFFGGKYSLHASTGFAFEVDTSCVYAKVSQHIGYVSERYLGFGSHLQLPTTLSLGVYNKNGSIGVFWKHFSNGTTSKYNVAREFVGVELGLIF